MATRNQRKRRANERQAARLKRIEGRAQAQRNSEVRAIVLRNLSQPRKRNYYAGIKSSVVMCEERGAHKQCNNLRPLDGLNDRQQAVFDARIAARQAKA